LSVFPQDSMPHHCRRMPRERSMQTRMHSGFPHSFNSGTSGPLKSSTACRATVDNASSGVASLHRPVAVSCGVAQVCRRRAVHHGERPPGVCLPGPSCGGQLIDGPPERRPPVRHRNHGSGVTASTMPDSMHQACSRSGDTRISNRTDRRARSVAAKSKAGLPHGKAYPQAHVTILAGDCDYR
jgi:hypothetical protein